MATRRRATPKPVSGPGALSQRTDLTPQGAAASRGQPIRVAPGAAYGKRQALETQQAAAPMAAGADPRMAQLAGIANTPQGADRSVFDATSRPGEPVTAGVGVGAGPSMPVVDPSDPKLLLQAMYSILPHPEIARLLQSG